jgi:hypothetical protein
MPRYYNRPKFLLAPDASTLVQPWLVFSQDKKDRPRRNTTPATMLPARRRATYAHGAVPRQLSLSCTQRIDPTGSCASRPHPPSPLNSSNSPIVKRQISFPHPPTLSDILRMEPDLSPTSAVMRASDVRLADLNLSNRTALYRPNEFTKAWEQDIVRPMVQPGRPPVSSLASGPLTKSLGNSLGYRYVCDISPSFSDHTTPESDPLHLPPVEQDSFVISPASGSYHPLFCPMELAYLAAWSCNWLYAFVDRGNRHSCCSTKCVLSIFDCPTRF